MEPLDVASADWIKDYDPLFDLFDEEMQTGVAEADAYDTLNQQMYHQNNNNTWSSSTGYDTYLTPISDYYFMAASFAASNASQQQQQQQQQQQRVYYDKEVVTPTEVASTSNAAAANNQPGYANAEVYDLNQYSAYSSNEQYQLAASEVAPTGEAAPAYNSKESVAQTTSSEPTYVAPQPQPQDIQQQQQQAQQQTSDFSNLFLGLDWLDNELPVSDTTSEAPSSISAPATPALAQIQSETTSSSSSAYSSLAPSPTSATTSTPSDIGTKTKNNNKKRKTIKSKGTSLLAHPSPKTAVSVTKSKNKILANVVTNGVVVSNNCGVITTVPIQLSTMASATTTTPTTTLAAKASKVKTTTPTRLLSKNVPILQLSRSASVPQHSPSMFVPVSTATTTTATLLTYSNIDNITRLGGTTLATAKLSKLTTTAKNCITSLQSETIVPTPVERRTLTGPELARRLCFSIEHDYAKKPR